MNPRSAKNKGSRFENHLVATLHKAGIKAQRTYGSGAGLDKNDIRLSEYDIEIECKNQKTIKLIEWWEQAQRQTMGNNHSALILRNPKKPEFQESLVVIELSEWVRLLLGYERKENEDSLPIQSNTTKYAIQRAKESLNYLLKHLE